MNRVLGLKKMMGEVMVPANELANEHTLVIGIANITFNRGLTQDLEDHLKNERQAIAQTSLTHDFIEGIMAFLEKRKPVFKGK